MNVIKVREAYFPRQYQIEWRERELSDADMGKKGILVSNKYTLISPGTELAFYTGVHTGLSDPNNLWAKYPFYPGYAAVGTIIKTGNEVSDFKEGDRVYTLGRHSSHTLEYLDDLSDRPVIKIPESLSPQKAVFARLAVISLTVLLVGKFQIGEYAVVIGLGLIGNLAAQLLELIGMHVIGIDIIESRLLKAKKCGIEYVVNSEKENIFTVVKEISGDKGVETVVEATGNSHLTNTALKVVNFGGQTILLGSPRGKVEIDTYNDIHRKGVRLVGAHEGLQGKKSIPNKLINTNYIMKLIEEKQLKVEELHTHTLKATEIAYGYELLLNKKEEALGILLDWEEV